MMNNKNYSHSAGQKENDAQKNLQNTQSCPDSKNRTEQKAEKNSRNNLSNVTADNITHTHKGENCGR